MRRRRVAKTRVARGLAWATLGVSLLLSGEAIAELEPLRDDERITGRALIERWAEASPSERKAMRARLRERWAEATPRQKRRFARRMRRLDRALPELSSIERLILFRVAVEMPKEERQALRERIARLDDVSAEERRGTIAELRSMVANYEGEVRRLEHNAQRWQGMSEAERDAYRSQMERWRALSDEEREALLEEMERRKRSDGDRGGDGEDGDERSD